MLVIVIAYLLLSFLVAILARRSKLGFFRGFLFSIMMTPFIVLLVLLILNSLEADPKKTERPTTGPSRTC